MGGGASWLVTVPIGGQSPVRYLEGWESQLCSVSSTLGVYGLMGTVAAIGRGLAGGQGRCELEWSMTVDRRGYQRSESALAAVFGIRRVGVGSGLIGGGSVFAPSSEGIVVNHGLDGNLQCQVLGGASAVSALLERRSRLA